MDDSMHNGTAQRSTEYMRATGCFWVPSGCLLAAAAVGPPTRTTWLAAAHSSWQGKCSPAASTSPWYLARPLYAGGRVPIHSVPRYKYQPAGILPAAPRLYSVENAESPVPVLRRAALKQVPVGRSDPVPLLLCQERPAHLHAGSLDPFHSPQRCIFEPPSFFFPFFAVPAQIRNATATFPSRLDLPRPETHMVPRIHDAMRIEPPR
ncbi:hypothetical protein TsFJ059_001849 [Trichoderma semiorbis]|uniref:Uncharacterized protein n=1 Tax=Trichoderma semiorbis TaxID=1491008 RepID=A0A9P8HYF7_9HYPO|nr:hypothetical protein TsFJ059_001849 [Trichoderma semiorbis]